MISLRVKKCLNKVMKFRDLKPIMNSRSILENWSEQHIANITNVVSELWDNALAQYAPNLMSYIYSPQSIKVTLLMEVSPEDRIYLQNDVQSELNQIQTKNRCAINLNLPSNIRDLDTTQVSITGQPDDVLNAYLVIRKLIPITIGFELKLNPKLSSIILDPNVQPLHGIQKTYGISIGVVPIQAPVIQATAGNHISIYVRSNKAKEDKLKAGIEELTKYIESNNFGNIYPNLSTKIDIPNNRPEIVGRTYSSLDPIATKTSTQIEVRKSTTSLMSSIAITGGDYHSICSARKEISDRFVVEINFDVSIFESKILENFAHQMERMGEEYGVHILMRPRPDPNHKLVIVKGTDKDVTKIFDARRHIEALLKNPQITQNNNYLY